MMVRFTSPSSPPEFSVSNKLQKLLSEPSLRPCFVPALARGAPKRPSTLAQPATAPARPGGSAADFVSLCRHPEGAADTKDGERRLPLLDPAAAEGPEAWPTAARAGVREGDRRVALAHLMEAGIVVHRRAPAVPRPLLRRKDARSGRPGAPGCAGGHSGAAAGACSRAGQCRDGRRP